MRARMQANHCSEWTNELLGLVLRDENMSKAGKQRREDARKRSTVLKEARESEEKIGAETRRKIDTGRYSLTPSVATMDDRREARRQKQKSPKKAIQEELSKRLKDTFEQNRLQPTMEVEDMDDDYTADIDQLVVRDTEPEFPTATIQYASPQIIIDDVPSYASSPVPPSTYMSSGITANAPDSTQISPSVTSDSVPSNPPQVVEVDTPTQPLSKDDEEDVGGITPPTVSRRLSMPIASARDPSVIMEVEPNYNGPWHINKKAFRVCYIIIIAIMLLSLLAIIVLQNYRKFMMTKLVSSSPAQITENIAEHVFTGGNVAESSPSNSLEAIAEQASADDPHMADFMSHVPEGSMITQLDPPLDLGHVSTPIQGGTASSIRSNGCGVVQLDQPQPLPREQFAQSLSNYPPRDAHGRFIKRK